MRTNKSHICSIGLHRCI